MPDLMTSMSHECDVTQLPIQDEDCYDLSDDESVPALIKRRMIDSDSDSSMDFERMARCYG
jgi:hypothetical protein